MPPNALHIRSEMSAAVAAALTQSNWEHWSDREVAVQRVTDALNETVMWRFDGGDVPYALAARCALSIRTEILPSNVLYVEILGGGWLRYGFIDEYGGDSGRYVSPRFDVALAHECGVHHVWNGEWYLDEKTLHCKVCGVDGT